MAEISSIKLLRSRLQDKGNGKFYSDWTEFLPRLFSIYFSRIFIFLNISPNQITLLSILFGVLVASTIVSANTYAIIIAAVILFFIPILDCCDGEVSRFSGQGSCSGEYLDRLAGTIIYPIILFSIGIWVFQYSDNVSDIIIGFIASFSLVLMRLSISYVPACALEEYYRSRSKPKDQTNLPQIPSINVSFEGLIKKPAFSKRIFLIDLLSDLFITKTWGIIYWIWLAGVCSLISLLFGIDLYVFYILKVLIWLFAVIGPIASSYIIIQSVKNKIPEKIIDDLTSNE